MNRTLYVLNTTFVHTIAPGEDDRNTLTPQVFDSFTRGLAAINDHAGNIIAHSTLGMGDTYTVTATVTATADAITQTEYTITNTTLNNTAL